ncbi:MAG: DUF4214 domain-containing protein [Chlorobiaceae bacterium]
MPSPNTSSATTSFNLSGTTNIDALLNGYKGIHTKWGGSVGTGTDLTFSFPWTGNANAVWASTYTDAGKTLPGYSDLNEQTAITHYGLNATQITATQNALQSWSNVANVTFTKVDDTATNVGDFRFGVSSGVGTEAWGHCYYPDSNASAADVWIAPLYAAETDWSAGSYNYQALIHEIGHGLGLKHPGNYNAGGGTTEPPYLPSTLDSTTYTVMSYTQAKSEFWDTTTQKYINVSATTPMVYDIQAIQYLYGANKNYHTGNDTYSFDPSQPFYMTIWDAAGIDTIDTSKFTASCSIDLIPGHYSSLHYSNQGSGIDGKGTNLYDGTNNLGIAFGAIIENVKLGSGNDTITGNDANNAIYAGTGNDAINGGAGIDTVIINGKVAEYAIALSGSGFSIKSTVGTAADTITNVESLQFTDHTYTIAATPDINLQESYRLYKAAFDRTPDYGGLGYWYNGLNHGISLTSVAGSFIDSAEFKNMYGSNPTDTTFVTELYQHVLGRTPDQGGNDFWLNDLKVETRAQVLTHFSESTENIAKVAGVITNGIIYEAYAA